LDIVNELGGHTGCVNALREVTFRIDIYSCTLTTTVGRHLVPFSLRVQMIPTSTSGITTLPIWQNRLHSTLV
jgi:hypothetical protein